MNYPVQCVQDFLDRFTPDVPRYSSEVAETRFRSTFAFVSSFSVVPIPATFLGLTALLNILKTPPQKSGDESGVYPPAVV